MKHTLPPLPDIAGEAWWLLRQNFGRVFSLVAVGYLLPIVAAGVTLLNAGSLSHLGLGGLLMLECFVAAVLVLVIGPLITEIALAAIYQRPEQSVMNKVGPYLGFGLIIGTGTLVVVFVVRAIGVWPLQLVIRFALWYCTIRISLFLPVLLAEGGVWHSLERAWNLLEGVTWRWILYRLVFAIPSGIVFGVLLIVLEMVLLSNIGHIDKHALRQNIPVLLGGVCLAALPLVAFVGMYMPFFGSVAYAMLVDQEEVLNPPVTIIDDESDASLPA